MSCVYRTDETHRKGVDIRQNNTIQADVYRPRKSIMKKNKKKTNKSVGFNEVVKKITINTDGNKFFELVPINDKNY